MESSRHCVLSSTLITIFPYLLLAQRNSTTYDMPTTEYTTSPVEPVICDPDEFACGSGICVPGSFVCDGYDDCGNMDDESVGCQPECPTSSEIPNCFTHTRISTNNETTKELNFTLDDFYKNFYLTRIAVSGNISSYWVRFTISEDSSSVGLKWNSSIRLQSVNLKSPLSINPEKSFTISVESISDINIQKWESANVTFEEIIGIQLLHSCKDSTDCFKSFNNASSVDERNCTLSSLERFLQDKYKYCVDICEAERLDDQMDGTLTFKKTNIAQTARSEEVCPPSSTREGKPRATRFCSGHKMAPGSWEDPVLNCFQIKKTDEFESLNNINVTENNVEAFSLLVATKTNITDFGTDDLVEVSSLLETIASVNTSSEEVTTNVVEIVDNLLDLEADTYRESVSKEVPSRILQALERQLTNLHRGKKDVNFTSVRSSVGVMAVSANDDFFTSELTFGNFFNSEEQDITERLTDSLTDIYKGNVESDNVKASITLPKSLLDETEHNDEGKLPLTFIVYRKSPLFVSNATKERGEAVESLVVSATIEGKKIEGLKNPVVTKFHSPVENNGNARRCVFWNASLANGSGDWSSQGCKLISLPECNGPPIVECSCNHLTNFAILVDVQGDINNDVLDVLSIIGCVVSIISLLITIATFLSNKKLRSKQPQQILINLCFALLGLYFSFLIGINRANFYTGCIIFGALIHFFCLSSVAWMSVEATNMYFMFIKVFKSGTNNFIKRASLAAWGGPLVIVVVLVSAKHSDYACKYCFPTAGSIAFTIGVLVPIPVMLVYNIVMFIFVIKSLTCRRQFSKDDSRKETIKRIQNAASISVLLGLSWCFGFLAIGGAQFIFNLVFLILNSLQGFFIFLLFCMRSAEMRSQWSRVTLPWKMSYTRSVSSQKSHTTDSSGVVLTRTSGKKMKESTDESSKGNCPENSPSQDATAL